MKGSKGYILLESLIGLVLLSSVVSTYLLMTVQLRAATLERLERLEAHRALYNQTKKSRILSTDFSSEQIVVSIKNKRAEHTTGGILIEKK